MAFIQTCLISKHLCRLSQASPLVSFIDCDACGLLTCLHWQFHAPRGRLQVEPTSAAVHSQLHLALCAQPPASPTINQQPRDYQLLLALSLADFHLSQVPADEVRAVLWHAWWRERSLATGWHCSCAKTVQHLPLLGDMVQVVIDLLERPQ